MSNYLQIQIADQKRGLKFNNRTTQFIKQETGIDPFNFKPVEDPETGEVNFGSLVDFSTKILYAALLSNYASQKKEPDFNKEEIIEWWQNEATPSDVYLIVNTYNSMMNPVVPGVTDGEGGKNTQA